MRNYYEILGVRESATLPQIKGAYREIAKKTHPDHTACDKTKEAQFREATEAYTVLSDENTKAQYDLFLETREEVDTGIFEFFDWAASLYPEIPPQEKQKNRGQASGETLEEELKAYSKEDPEFAEILKKILKS